MSAVLRYELLYWLIDLQGVSACVSQSATQNSMVSTKSDQKFARVPFNWSSTPSYYHLQYYPCISASPGSGLLCKLRPSGMDLQEAWRDLVVMTWHQHEGSLSALKSHAPGSRNLGHTLAIPQAANTSSKAGQRVVQQSCLPILVQKMVGPLYARGCTTTFPARNGLLANLRSMADEFCAGKNSDAWGAAHGSPWSPRPARGSCMVMVVCDFCEGQTWSNAVMSCYFMAVSCAERRVDMNQWPLPSTWMTWLDPCILEDLQMWAIV